MACQFVERLIAELDGAETEALDLIPLVTNSVLEEHYLIVGVVVVVHTLAVTANEQVKALVLCNAHRKEGLNII
jgi:hypothetical protein